MMEAAFGFLGVIVGSFIPWIKESITQKQSRTEEGTYLAVRVICILEEYADACIHVVQDDGTILGQAVEQDNNGVGLYIPQVPIPPGPTFPDDVNWKSIDTKLMYRILSFPNMARSINDSINFVANDIASPPDYYELFEARWEGYINLGLEAIEIAKLLRVKYKLPKETRNTDWDPKQYLDQRKRDIEDRKEKRADDFEKTFAPLVNITNSKGKKK